jgi:hypothetical protein
MSYLIYNDYKKSIQNINLQQVIGSDLSILIDWQRSAQEQAVSHLVQKYDISIEFTDTKVYDFTKTYNAADRVYLESPTYVPSSTYQINSLTQYLNNVYISIATATGSFDPTKWTLLGAEYDLFFVAYPLPLFNINSQYLKGDQVFWKGFKYTAINDSPIISVLNIQYANYRNIPNLNYFPDGLDKSQWGTGIAFSVPAGTLPTNALFTKADNRSQQMVEYISDIVIYKIHKRISPQNIPIQRHENYKMALQWFMDCATGMVTPNLPLIQPNKGNRIRYGGNIQNINHY